MDGDKMRRSTLRTRRWIILIFCLFAAIVAVFLYQHTYSKHKWDADKENRHKIVGDMLRKNDLIGMREEEVIALLGDGDSSGQTSFKISRKHFPPASTLVYYLGVDIMDNQWLIISLENGVVVDYCMDVT